MLKYPLNTLITIEKGVSGTTSMLSEAFVYSDYMITYANVYARSGSVRYGESEELIYTTEFTIYHNSLSKDIDNTCRIKYDNNYYSIIEVIELEYRQYIKLVGQRFYGR